jgi:hypothetical protein
MIEYRQLSGCAMASVLRAAWRAKRFHPVSQRWRLASPSARITAPSTGVTPEEGGTYDGELNEKRTRANAIYLPREFTDLIEHFCSFLV